jgi:hypothetical protein
MFENLKDVLGEAYHDDITAEEVNSFFSGKNFADLSTGQYVDKNKYDRDIQALNTTITEKQNALNSKMTDDERAQQERQQDKDEIARLTELLKTNTVNSNKDYAMSSTNNIKTILGIKDDDVDYTKFIDTIVSDDRQKTGTIAHYVSKIANDAYEKGKKDALKDNMGSFGKSKKSNEDGSNDVGALGAELAKATLSNKETVDYFARKK